MSHNVTVPVWVSELDVKKVFVMRRERSVEGREGE